MTLVSRFPSFPAFPECFPFPLFLAKYCYGLHLTHKPCNFHIEEVIGEGGLPILTKNVGFTVLCLTLMHNAIFTKKKQVMAVDGLTALAKRIGFTLFTFDSGIL